jgi:hypothetical protein
MYLQVSTWSLDHFIASLQEMVVCWIHWSCCSFLWGIKRSAQFILWQSTISYYGFACFSSFRCRFIVHLNVSVIMHVSFVLSGKLEAQLPTDTFYWRSKKVAFLFSLTYRPSSRCQKNYFRSPLLLTGWKYAFLPWIELNRKSCGRWHLTMGF